MESKNDLFKEHTRTPLRDKMYTYKNKNKSSQKSK